MTRKASLKLLMLGLPIVAIAALVLVLTLGTGGSSKKVEATQGTPNQASLSIGSCTGPKCGVALGTTFTVATNIVQWTGAYDGMDIIVDTTVGAPKSANCAAWTSAPGHFDLSGVLSPTQAEVSCARGTADAPSTQKGQVGSIVINCTQNGTLTIDAASTLVVAGAAGPISGSPLQVNCLRATATATNTATATPPPVPKMQKLPALSRIWLTVRKPPARCQDQAITIQQNGTAINGQILSETLSQPVVTTSKVGPQHVSAFQFEIRYDSKQVCIGIQLNPAQATANPNASCSIVSDGLNMGFGQPQSPPTTKGVARIGCVTFGKTTHFDDTKPLAFIGVVPTTAAVQSLRPNQDNGIAVQILNQNCNLADNQGHTIPIFSCESADIVIKFLEGDVVPNCVVDVSDTQDIAFRWGARKGSLIFSTFKDLAPSHPAGDGVIDIQDLQAVFGRFNSTCKNPQEGPVVNPKG